MKIFNQKFNLYGWTGNYYYILFGPNKFGKLFGYKTAYYDGPHAVLLMGWIVISWCLPYMNSWGPDDCFRNWP